MNKIIKKKNFSDIEILYNIFFFDLYGVIHNGVHLFPNILNILRNLKKLNKIVVFISNAPRKSIKIKKFLKSIGLRKNLYFDVVSSGDITYEEYLIKINRKKFYFIGARKDKNFCNGLKITEEFCVNPDLEIIREKKKEICAGALALQYEKLGGKVKYFGKPYKKIYQKTLEKIKVKNKKKIIAIGDSLRTDILGANNFGIDSALVLSGIHGNIKAIEKLCKKTNIYPKFLLNKLE